MSEAAESTSSAAEKHLQMLSRVCRARHNETMRVAELIEMAMYDAKSEDVQEALLNLASKVLKP